MTEQHRTTDIENLWLEWNKANQDLWNRMLQSWIETETFAQLLGKAMQNYLTMHEAFGKALQGYMVQALQTMPGGHIGLVTSRKAVKNLWPKVVDWLAKHSD